jgi:dihydroflavonol-4-reductase
MSRAVVVGGTGFIGLAVVDALIEAGVTVKVTRRKRSITALVRKRPVELVAGSLSDEDSLAEAFRGQDAVVVTAGHYPRYSLDLDASVKVAVDEIRNACRAAHRVGVPRLVFTSSTGSLAPAPAGRPADERDVPPDMPRDSVYRAVKWAMEREVEAWAAEGLNAVTMLPGGCFGPGDLRLGTGGILVGAVRGELPWYVDGVVPIVDVADVARAHVAAALRDPPRDRYCIGGRAIRVRALLERIVGRYGGRVPPQLGLNEARERADAAEREAAPHRRRVPVPRELVDVVASGQAVSSARAEADLGVRFRPMDETLDRAHAWFDKNGYLQTRVAPAPTDPRAGAGSSEATKEIR